MLLARARTVLTGAARQATARQPVAGFHSGAPAMVSIKDLADKITSTQSIEKITKSMKMVSAAKLRGDQERLEKSKTFTASFENAVFPQTEELRAGPASEDAGDVPERDANPRHLNVLLTTDRGLCGGVNSGVVKVLRFEQEENPSPAGEMAIMVLGEKGRSQTDRLFPGLVQATVSDQTRQPMCFATASGVATRILATAEDFDAGSLSLVYNKFRSAIAYDTLKHHLENFSVGSDSLGDAGEGEGPDAEAKVPAYLREYEMEPENKAEALQNLFEFSLAGTVYGLSVENAASEQSARMAAMENASKNAGEMIERFTLQYNRARQAKITTELIEIISGAESLKG